MTESAALALLSPGERTRAYRFRFPFDRSRYALAHAFLRHVLANYLGTHPRALRFATAAGGKPWLVDDRSLHFSLSHSGDVVAIAVARTGPVGIDVEVVRELADSARIARAFLSPSELASIERLPAAERSRSILRSWSRREAVAKASGAGIGKLAPVDSCSPRWIDWTCRDLAFDDMCVAAVAFAGGDAQREVHELMIGDAHDAIISLR